MTEDYVDDEYLDDEDQLDVDEEAGVDCTLDLRTGQCMKAGSEECDFDCPLRNTEDFAGSAAWYRKRGETPPWEKKP